MTTQPCRGISLTPTVVKFNRNVVHKSPLLTVYRGMGMGLLRVVRVLLAFLLIVWWFFASLNMLRHGVLGFTLWMVVSLTVLLILIAILLMPLPEEEECRCG